MYQFEPETVMLVQNTTKVLNGQKPDKVLRDKIWWLSELSHIYARYQRPIRA